MLLLTVVDPTESWLLTGNSVMATSKAVETAALLIQQPSSIVDGPCSVLLTTIEKQTLTTTQ